MPPHDHVILPYSLLHGPQVCPCAAHKDAQVGDREHAVDLVRKILTAAIAYQAEPLKDRFLVVEVGFFPHGGGHTVQFLAVGHTPQILTSYLAVARVGTNRIASDRIGAGHRPGVVAGQQPTLFHVIDP